MLPARTALALSNHASESVEAVDLASPPRPRWARGGVLSQAGDDTMATSCRSGAPPDNRHAGLSQPIVGGIAARFLRLDT